MHTSLASFDVAIVGAGHAGAQAAIALRQQGHRGSIGLIGDEPDAPYERPPLSKEYLSGAKPFERILLRPEEFWEARDIARLPSTRIEAVDAKAKRLTDSDGEPIDYGTLIWATGGEPRRLPCGSDVGLAGVHAIRTRADVDLLREELDAAERIVIVGGGYIGLEAAAVLVQMAKRVIVIEAADRVLNRVAGAPLSRFYEEYHRAAGVDIRLDTMTDRLEGRDGRLTHVHLADGGAIETDLVIIGIGIAPSVGPLVEAGAEGGADGRNAPGGHAGGVRVDGQCRTSLKNVYAIGDCALHENAYADGAAIRLESVQNANDMAAVAAASIMGKAADYKALPWFWSNQYDLKLQTVGLSGGHDDIVTRGDPASGSFSLCYLKAGRLIAVDAVNRVADYAQARKLIEARAEPPRDLLADGERPLKALLTA